MERFIENCSQCTDENTGKKLFRKEILRSWRSFRIPLELYCINCKQTYILSRKHYFLVFLIAILFHCIFTIPLFFVGNLQLLRIVLKILRAVSTLFSVFFVGMISPWEMAKSEREGKLRRSIFGLLILDICRPSIANLLVLFCIYLVKQAS